MAPNWFQRFIENYKRFRREPQYRLELTDDGFRRLDHDDELASVRWDDVRHIVVYKVDLFSYDEICIEFIFTESLEAEDAGKSSVEVTEHDEGFQAFFSQFHERFPAIDATWYERIMLPAFATNYTELWHMRQE